jgi:competence protein ComEC
LKATRLGDLNGPPRIGRWIERRRESLSEALKPVDEHGILRSVLLSENADESAGFLRLLGFVHFTTASGLHLYFLSMAITGLTMLWIRSESAIPVAQTLSALITGWAWLLAGARPGMLAPWLLLSLQSCSKGLGLKWRPLVLWAGVAALTGSILYALAVYGAMEAGTLSRAVGAWSLLALAQVATDGLLNGLTPLLSWLLLPMIAMIFYPGLVLLSLTPTCAAQASIHLLAPLFRLFNEFVTILIGWDLHLASIWVIPRPALLGGAWLSSALLYTKRKWVYFALPLVVALPLRGLALANRGAVSTVPNVEQLDVGQGDGALVTRGDTVGLIDTGAIDALRPEDWMRLLARRGLDHIDWIALTHLDADHAGGARTLAALLPVGCIETSPGELESPRGQDLIHFMQEREIPIRAWGSGCVPYPVLAPPEGRSGPNANMGAILVPLAHGDCYLSMGDAEGEDELKLAGRAQALRTQMHWDGALALKLSHHGSRTSSGAEVLKILHPRIAIISDGIGNPYGHPSEEVLSRAQSLGIPVYRTDQLGSVDVAQALHSAYAQGL